MTFVIICKQLKVNKKEKTRTMDNQLHSERLHHYNYSNYTALKVFKFASYHNCMRRMH